MSRIWLWWVGPTGSVSLSMSSRSIVDSGIRRRPSTTTTTTRKLYIFAQEAFIHPIPVVRFRFCWLFCIVFVNSYSFLWSCFVCRRKRIAYRRYRVAITSCVVICISRKRKMLSLNHTVVINPLFVTATPPTPPQFQLIYILNLPFVIHLKKLYTECPSLIY